jgi:hypothetical protein
VAQRAAAAGGDEQVQAEDMAEAVEGAEEEEVEEEEQKEDEVTPLFPWRKKGLMKEPVPGGIWFTTRPDYIAEEELPMARKFHMLSMSGRALEAIKQRRFESTWEDFKRIYERPLLTRWQASVEARRAAQQALVREVLRFDISEKRAYKREMDVVTEKLRPKAHRLPSNSRYIWLMGVYVSVVCVGRMANG